MIAAEDTILVLLAAGKSARFAGAESKLDASVNGAPLGLHAAHTLSGLTFKARVAIVRRCRIDYAAHGFEMVRNEDPVGDMASSIRLGIRSAQRHGAAAVLIALADMPRLSAHHVQRLLAAADGAHSVVASASAGSAPKPPALFGSARFDELLSLSGDHGARDLIRAGRLVEAPAATLVDIDTHADLAALAAAPVP
ncbi:nucleotidyltransferase family protein [Sphingomonas dokdonensis]|uniref:Purine catabolism protein PucB n=1 Tax=Sphingomonas dokdonensis TaxID=344880 RepID=A0A245ZF84_9SPHN|nr:nucleotidyltransferase family protein [Sphingomonas dokdonensis]OWK28373.1 purine catabolism protein PucB [Sphingomonas dokdonensis]